MPNEIAPLFADLLVLHAAPNPLDPLGITEGYGVARRADGAGNVGSDSLRLCILGEPASKANSRRLAKLGGRIVPIKSQKALDYETIALPQIAAQCGKAGWKCRAVGSMRVTMTIHYASERPDLDESVVLDVMQLRVYGNDRQVREKHIFHAIDRKNPRTEILIEALS